MTSLPRLKQGVALAIAAAVALAPAGASGPSPQAKLDKLLDGRIAGTPVSCLNLRDIRSSEIIDRTAIVYQVGSKLYVNYPQSGADMLDRDDVLVTKSVTGQLCRIDIVHLVDRAAHFQRGFVSLGDFVPYSKR